MNIVLKDEYSSVHYAAQLDLDGRDSNKDVVIEQAMMTGNDNLGRLVSVNFISDNNYNLSKRTFSESLYGRINRFSWDDEPVIFSGLFENNFVTGNQGYELGNNELGRICYSGQRRIRADEKSTKTINVPQNSQRLLAVSQQIMQGVNSESIEVDYDFSGIGNGRSIFEIRMYDNQDISWSITGPLSGTIPDLDLPTNIETRLSQMSSPGLSIATYGYHFSGTYHQYLAKYAQESRKTGQIRGAFFDNWEVETLYIN